MDNTYLMHWGKKGMKWGVRRYQNEDGSLTLEGKRRYDRDIRDNNAKKKDNRIIIDGPDANRWVKEDISRTKNVVDGAKTATKEFNDVVKKMPSKNKNAKMNLDHMSNKELRELIERETLERKYNEMFASEERVSKGRYNVEKTLETAGTVLTIGSTALAIALAIKELKG